MRKIKVKFLGFYCEDFDNAYYKLLKKRYEVELCEEPDYLFYSCLALDAWKDYSCIRIFVSAEMITPEFNFCDYAIGHDNLEFGDRYFRYPAWLSHTNMEKIKNKRTFSKDDLLRKNKFCNYIYSNFQKGCEYRIELYHYINKNYKKVDSAGKHMHEIDIPEIVKGDWVKNKVEFMKAYKFTIAIENGSHLGYVTEKLSNAFEAGTIPIYFGSADVAKEFNEDSFINCHRYKSFDEILNKIREVDNNDELYLNMMQCDALLVNPDDYIKGIEEFLFHIIEQPYEQAFRRNRTCWGNILEERHKHEQQMLELLENNIAFKIARKGRRIIRRVFK